VRYDEKKSYASTCDGQAMIIRFFILLIGFGLAVAGGVSLLAYLNLLAAGYDFSTYLQFVIRRIEFYLLLIGAVLIWSSIYIPSQKRND